jgi:hypothetical protein
VTLVDPEFPCGNFPTRKCDGPCADFCERFPWLLPNHEGLDDIPRVKVDQQKMNKAYFDRRSQIEYQPGE